MSLQPASEYRKQRGGSDVLGSVFQAETAATTKARSPIEGRLVAGMITGNGDDAAESRYFRPGTSDTRRTSDDKYPGAVPFMHWNIIVTS